MFLPMCRNNEFHEKFYDCLVFININDTLKSTGVYCNYELSVEQIKILQSEKSKLVSELKSSDIAYLEQSFLNFSTDGKYHPYDEWINYKNE